LHFIDEQPKEAVASLLRIIAYHDRLAARAEDKNLEESQRYHEASRKDAEELLAIYEKRWPQEAAVRKSEYAAEAATAGNYPSHGAIAVIEDAEKTVWLAREKGCSPRLRKRPPF
jgi:hypothetical protein